MYTTQTQYCSQRIRYTDRGLNVTNKKNEICICNFVGLELWKVFGTHYASIQMCRNDKITKIFSV